MQTPPASTRPTSRAQSATRNLFFRVHRASRPATPPRDPATPTLARVVSPHRARFSRIETACAGLRPSFARFWWGTCDFRALLQSISELAGQVRAALVACPWQRPHLLGEAAMPHLRGRCPDMQMRLVLVQLVEDQRQAVTEATPTVMHRPCIFGGLRDR